ncbi:MAG: hypothetical protein KGM43_15595 [Planctomycetota bacterium]|nr:hypothetical protein [Planctomycetota bacterium]
MHDFEDDESKVEAQPRSRGDVPRGRITEDRVEDHRHKKLLLKCGREMQISEGLGCATGLRMLLEEDPGHFQVLLSMACGQEDGHPINSVAFLRRALFLQKGGVINPRVRDVLLSAYQETPDGAAIVNPFRLETEADVRAVESVELSGVPWILDELRKPDEPERGQ